MYLGLYGLQHEPFRLSPDLRFLHLAETHKCFLRSMLEGVGARRGLQVATGPVGTGKTTLLYGLQHLLAKRASGERPLQSAFLINPTLSPEEFHEALLIELEISCTDSKPARLRALHELLLNSYRANGNVVLIVDEAHLVSPAVLEEIRLLQNLDNYSRNVLQIILCGQPELLPLLERPELAALKQRIAVYSHLRALVVGETRAYVAERLHVAGLRGDSPFTAVAIEEIHRFSGGVPRLINLLCDRCLNLGHRQQMGKIGSDCVLEAADELNLAESRRPWPAINKS